MEVKADESSDWVEKVEEDKPEISTEEDSHYEIGQNFKQGNSQIV